MIYKGVYRHKENIIPVDICNNGRELSMEIEGLLFKGSEFTDLSYQGNLDEVQIDEELFTIASHLADCLTDCQFEFTVPQNLVTSEGIKETIELEMCFRHGGYNEQSMGLEYEEVIIKFVWKGNEYIGKDGFVEIAFDQLMRQLPKGDSFVNCYGCLYGDYSIYGNSSFGTMMCFKNLKQKYKAIDNKSDYGNMCADEKDNIDWVQEIHYCDEFEVRGNNGIYR